jgi:hypothetical protein
MEDCWKTVKSMDKYAIDYLDKRPGHEKALEINKTILEKSLFSNLSDYEDAVIEISAKEKNIDYIITRNIKDFKKSQIKPLLPEEYLAIKR